MFNRVPGRHIGLTVAMFDYNGRHIGLMVAMLDPGFHVGLAVASMLDYRSPPCWTTYRRLVGLPVAMLCPGYHVGSQRSLRFHDEVFGQEGEEERT